MPGKTLRTLLLGVVLCVPAWTAGPALAQTPLTEAFTYQGQLQSAGTPYSGSADLRFTLWPDSTAGTQIGGPSVVSNITVVNGVFTAVVNGGGEFDASPFDGSQRWLKIGVRTPHDPTNTLPFTALSPRQILTGAPYALGLGFPFFGTGSSTTAPLFKVKNTGSSEAISGLSVSGNGVYGRNGAGSGLQPLLGYGTGVWGDTDNGNGLVGTSGTAFGVYGAVSPISGLTPPTIAGVVGDSRTNTGVIGLSMATGVIGLRHGSSGIISHGESGVWGDSDNGNGVTGTTSMAIGRGVAGEASADNGVGVFGKATSSTGIGVEGIETATSGTNVGIYGGNSSPSGYAGWFQGNVHVTGTLTKGGGSFKIDHPLDPQNKYLYHSFVESPDMMDIYNGIVTTDARGYATVTLPDWFEALNRDFRYQLTVIDATDADDFVLTKVVKEIADHQFTLRTSKPATRVSWQVTGIRHDAFANAHRIPVEEDKPLAERGRYLYPREMGRPVEEGLAANR